MCMTPARTIPTPGDCDARDSTLLAVLPWMRRLAYRQGRTPADRLDLAQESALTFLEKWPTFDGRHAHLFARWMVSHARRRIHARRRRHDAEVLVEEPPAREPGPTPTERAEAEAAHTATVRRLRAAVGSLPVRRRDVVVSRFGLGGATPAILTELAGGLGVSKQRVQQIEAAALRQLAAALATPTATQESKP